jgi:glycerol-3-phosphate dehydrogenase
LLAPEGVIGARVRDELSGDEHEILARATVLAGGAASGALLQTFGRTPGPQFVRAMNVLLDRPARAMALAAPGRSGRMLTAVPWRGCTLVGTWQSPAVVAPGASHASAAEVDDLLAEANVAFPALRATRADVRLLHQGLTPAVVRRGRAELMPESLVLRPGWPERRGLFAAVGVKFTTARQTAEQVVDAVCHFLGTGSRHASTATTRLPHAGLLTDHDRITATPREIAHDAALVRGVLDWYGTEASALFAWSRTQGLLERLVPDLPILAGEVGYAVKVSQAVRLADVVMRRTALGSAGHPGPSALARAAEIMGHLLAWTPDERAREVADVEARYRLPEV